MNNKNLKNYTIGDALFLLVLCLFLTPPGWAILILLTVGLVGG